MTDLTTERLTLRPATEAEATRIVDRTPAATDRWAADFPFEGDVVGATMFLRASKDDGEQQPFGFYVIERRADGRAIGGIGFKGRPRDGVVEIGYGLAPSARGAGYAAEAVGALIDLAREHGLVRVVADTAQDNIASQRTLARAGLIRADETGEPDETVDELRYQIDL
ncbi:GNAT family N-acetyltransferase [Arsenicicoccus piscis]|uniref:N-acetyltransferase domain-containing protein n=1 Tax=Arsenicicoccus piscis TaxID=673954 RepID=A0ABQ6HPK2_9MICO|nr:GNAT family N-acetyltransferase [Arsenicicoccus piscis]MCH8629336.1 GNAT family N-acetyltransferase [Arsenicicoccus piscis]GMA20396.1 hypothetical protein GCM10025862_24170 [Arsenicicoccus piscis]